MPPMRMDNSRRPILSNASCQRIDEDFFSVASVVGGDIVSLEENEEFREGGVSETASNSLRSFSLREGNMSGVSGLLMINGTVPDGMNRVSI